MGFEQVNDAVEFEAAFYIPGDHSNDITWCIGDGIAIGYAIDGMFYFWAQFAIEIRLLEVLERLKSFDRFKVRRKIMGDVLLRFIQDLLHLSNFNWRNVVTGEWT